MFGEIIADYSENFSKHTRTLCKMHIIKSSAYNDNTKTLQTQVLTNVIITDKL